MIFLLARWSVGRINEHVPSVRADEAPAWGGRMALTPSPLSLKNMIFGLRVTQKARLSPMWFKESRGESEFPVPLSQDSSISASWRNVTGINNRSELGSLKTKSANTGRREEK